MVLSGPTLTSASSSLEQVDYNPSTGKVIGFSLFGTTLPATCSPAYGELCPLDAATEMVAVGFTEVYNGYNLDINSAVVSSSDAYGTPLAFSTPGAPVTIANCVDTDSDTVCDAVDICNGFDDLADNDSDLTPDGCDDCDDDPNKVAEGACGCGVADTDCAYVSLGDVVELPSECSWVCQSTTTDDTACTFADPDQNYTFVEVCSSPGYGLPVNYYAGQDVTGFQFNVSNLNITGATGGATDGMEIFFSDNGNVAGIINSSSGAGTAAAGTGVLTTLVFTDATDASSVLSMDSSDAIAGPISGSDSQAFVFQAPSNQAQASGSVSHCGENGVSNSSAHWSLDTCSADCSGSWYSGSLLDECSVCDADLSNNCTQDCNGDWCGQDIKKDNGYEA